MKIIFDDMTRPEKLNSPKIAFQLILLFINNNGTHYL